jgi:hypothetical protein
MANPEHLGKLREGVKVWNEWKAKHRGSLFLTDLSWQDLRRMNIPGIDLTDTNLDRVDFAEVNLEAADLSRANLRTVSFGSATLRDAVLNGVNARGADFSRADMRGVDLRYADLRRAKFSETDLRWAELSDAHLYQTIFSDTDLRRTKGLDQCVHSGPSSIDQNTLMKSGALPNVFLRGCGLSDSLIDYLPSLLDQAIQFYSCFVSYSSQDQHFADRLYADLQARGVRCWFAPHDVKGGRKLHEQIDEAIRLYDRLLLVLSDASMNSEWVKTEIANARKRETREKAQMLFPIGLVPFEKIRDWKAFDADTGKDSAREIREYFIPDFSNWKDHDSYQKAFERLLKDLKAEARTGATE